ncbi:MAG: TIR domain-containing protein, partial [Clostridia bacterium]|nr:TIR domain-containing protein [Clostridia bacterium]
GFKVFFARITLEDKLGSAYEPYIFAALNSAKVMVVLGTKPEFFNAVWVKNEWSRYLALIKQGQKKMLIPAYKDMDPYDLPEEFSHLQAQDMSKLGFMQDLIRGIKKIAQADVSKATVVKETVVSGGSANTAPLLERVALFLEDGKWQDANIYCEKVLDIDPKNAEAYLGKLMSELQVKKRKQLADCAEPFDNRDNYSKVLRFGDSTLEAEMRGYITHINTRNENARLDGIYTRAQNAMSSANTENTYKEAAKLFESIAEYRDSASLAEKCYEKAEEIRKDRILSEGKSNMVGNRVSKLEEAIRLFQSISGWRNADEQVDICQRKIEEIKAKQEADRLERERRAEIARKEAERRAKRNKKIAIITTPIVCAVIAFIIVLNVVIIPNGKYNDAVALMNSGKYTEAIAAFEELDGYKDSANQIANCKYSEAVALMNAGKYTEAIAAFEELDGYKDSANQIANCKYSEAVALMDSDVVQAYEALIALDGYKDSADKANSIYVDYKDAKIKNASVGDYIKFGAYEQDNNTENGKEDVEWLVLDKKEDRILVISKYGLDCKPYNKKWKIVTWETCTLRKWLNDEFIKNAFSSDERKKIPTIKVSDSNNPVYGTKAGKTTRDKVFLLSIAECYVYFASDEARMCAPTDYAIAQGAYTNDDCKADGRSTCRWWLRSPGYGRNYAAAVDSVGKVGENGSSVHYFSEAVRPAMWIKIP